MVVPLNIPLKEQLSRAVIDGDAAEVRLLLDAGADPFWKDGSGITAFHHAAERVDTAILGLLLEKKPEGAHALDEDDATPMHYAAHHGRIAAMEMLHTHGGRIDAQEKDGRRPLMRASFQNRQGAVEWLLKMKAEPNAQDDRKRTALHFCVARRYLGVAIALVNAGADTTIPDANNVTPLGLAQAMDNGASKDFNVAQFLTAVEVQKSLRHGTTRPVTAPRAARFTQKAQD